VETKWVDQEQEVCVPVWTKEIRKVPQRICKQVTEDKVIEVTVAVTTKEKRMGKKLVCEKVPETKTIEVCVPVPSCGAVVAVTASGCKGGCSQPTCGCCPGKVVPLAPQYTTETRTVTVFHTVQKEVPFEYEACVCKMEKRQKTVKVCHTVSEIVETEQEVSVCHMEKRKQMVKVAVCSTVCGGCNASCCA